MPDDLSLDRQKYELEKQKFDFEYKKFERENTFLQKNLAIVITGLVSTATIIVSCAQIYISYQYNQTQLDAAREQNKRTFSFDVAKFLLERKSEFSTQNALEAGYISRMVVTLFPEDMSTKISGRMADFATDPEVKQAWADANTYAKSVGAPVGGSQAAGVPAISLSPEKLAKAFNELNNPTALKELKLILEEAKRFGITGGTEVAIYMTLILHESNFLRIKEDRLDLSAERLLLLWPSRFTSLDRAKPYEHNAEKLANFIYGGRMGNEKPGDGYKYRGRGYLLIAGRDAYRRLGQAIGVDLEGDPDLMFKPEIDAKASAHYFSIDTKAITKARSDDLVGATLALDGAIVGLAAKRVILNQIKSL